MSQDGSVHTTFTRQAARIDWFNIGCWVGGSVISLLFLIFSSRLESLIIAPVAFLIGMPIRNAGSPHKWVMIKLRNRKSRKRNKGVQTAPPLSRHNQKFEPNPWEKTEIVTAGVRYGKEVLRLPLITDPTRNYLTMILKIKSGAAANWVNSDGEGKYEWDRNYFEGFEDALAITKEKDLWVSNVLMSRPSDKTLGYEYNRGRLQDKILEAAAAPNTAAGIDPVDRLLGLNAMSHHDASYDVGGDTFNYVAVRMPWPRRYTSWSKRNGSRAKIENPDVFAKTKLSKTIKQLIINLGQQDLDAGFTTKAEVAQLLGHTHNLRLLDTRNTYGQRDREMVEDGIIGHIDDAPSAESTSWKPLSISSDPQDEGWIKVDGTYIAAGYAVSIKKAHPTPGFQESALNFPNDIYFSVATIINAKLVETEKKKAREAERLNVMKGQIGSMNNHLSNPDGDKELNEIVSWREDLADTGARSGEAVITFTLMAPSLEKLKDNWETAIIAASKAYEFKQVMSPAEIEDILLGQIAVFL